MRSLASSKTIDGFLLWQPPRPLFPSSCFPSNWWSGSCETLSTSAKTPWNLKFTQTSPKQNAFIPVYTADTKMMRKERPASGPSLPSSWVKRSACQLKCWQVALEDPWSAAARWWLDFSPRHAGRVSGRHPLRLTSQGSKPQDPPVMCQLGAYYRDCFLGAAQAVKMLMSYNPATWFHKQRVLPNTHFPIQLLTLFDY